ncbi:MAG TPA: cadherin-like domain-containing protein, partial [Pseudonocardiaceae bacterium]|nr:cadherin-like domain-containing protein [Pseudonocardiaceae bacterium]
VPESFPTVFADEHFYWAAGADLRNDAFPGFGGLLVLGLEAAFGHGPVTPGDQVVFGRLRIRLKDVPFNGTYRVYTPYGVFTFPDLVANSGRFSFTQDIGLNCPPGAFDCALSSSVGPFLLPSSTPGGAELPPVGPSTTGLQAPYPGTGKKYIADPLRTGPVTGSPLPGFTTSDGPRNPNIFRVEYVGPGQPLLLAETFDFSLMGRIYEGAVPSRVTLDRASYARPVNADGTGNKLDVYATALPGLQARLPGMAPVAPVSPALVFYEGPCRVDPATGALARPDVLRDLAGDPVLDAAGAVIPLAPRTMGAVPGWKFQAGQSQPGVLPPAVCVEQTNALDVTGRVVPSFSQAPVGDQITITEALFDPDTLSLSVKATSSDLLFPPLLTLGGYGDLVNGQLTVSALKAPPRTITVVSAAAGLNQRRVDTRYSTGVNSNVPLAANDTVALLEDGPATTIDVLANDRLRGAPVPAGAVVTIIAGSGPQLGTAVVNANGTITYVPRLNANGTDGFTYTVTVADVASNAAGVSIAIAPVSDAPTAVADAFNATVNVSATLNVFANDSDPDGDLSSAVVVLPPVGATVTGGANGVFTFSAPVAGTYAFTYAARDAAGSLSAPATVTVSVFAAETITVGRAEFTTRQLRWVITGNAAPAAGQQLTISYFDGPNRNFVVANAVVSQTGTWSVDFRPATGLYDPRNAQAAQIVVTGPGGGRAVASFRIK